MGQHCVPFNTRLVTYRYADTLPVCVTTHGFALDNQSKKDGLCSSGSADLDLPGQVGTRNKGKLGQLGEDIRNADSED